MDQFEQYIDQSANSCLSSPAFLSLTDDQKQEMVQKIKEHLYNIILLTTLDNLTDEQFVQIKDLPPQDPVLAQKLEEFASTMPHLAQEIEEKINKDSEYIKQTGQLPQQTQ